MPGFRRHGLPEWMHGANRLAKEDRMKTAKPVIVMFAALAAVMLAGWIAVAAA